MRRWILPAVLALVTSSSAVLAVRAPGPADEGGQAGPAVRAPVLSPRRLPALLAQVVADTRLRSALDQALGDPALGGGRERSCLVVRHGRRPIFERRPDERLIPASNLKVLTGLAVLAKLGPGERLVTEVRTGKPTAGGVVEGPLWLVGGGDPLLGTVDYAASFVNQPQLYTPMETLADEVVAAGVREVRGGVMGDETRYDTQRYVPTWRPVYATAAEVGPASALVVNDGFVVFTPRHVAAPEPDVHAAGVLTALLQARGVAVTGAPGQGSAPSGASTLARVASAPMREVVAEMLRESDNLTAELLVKELGRRYADQGTTAAGIGVVRETLLGAGLPVAHLVAVDGSGLDRSDRASCTLLMAALDVGGRHGPVAAGLPVAGRDGTLSRRFLGNPAAGRLQAKTGALEGVAGLTGYLDLPGAEPLVFSLLVNELPRDAVGRAIQERVGAILATYPQAPSPEALGP
ncbi:MAG: D-alanyl-D-alanine carboxypeptidase/D-alanyl-D-alanine-endopeptidase [Actinomycetota bacterium]|nr:D-alanyl-D-alanine carboxypeptidase/D-alanyl-D-alanine-endopeptidase [Actinomycetota bacterium]